MTDRFEPHGTATTRSLPSRAIVLGVIAVLALGVLVGGAAGAGTTDVTVEGSNETVGVGETTTVQVVLSDADDGVGAGDFGVEVTDPSVATITEVQLDTNPGIDDVTIADDGSRADVSFALADTPDTGEVTVATVTLRGESAGSARLGIGGNADIGVRQFADETGTSYELASVEGAAISVGDGNSPPTADPVNISTTAGTEVSGSFEATDPDGDSLSYEIVDRPDHGAAQVSRTGLDPESDQFFYTPTSGFTGVDSFTYEVSDGNGGSDTATVFVSVDGADDGSGDGDEGAELATVSLPETGGSVGMARTDEHLFVVDDYGSTRINVYEQATEGQSEATYVATKTVPEQISGIMYEPVSGEMWATYNGDPFYRIEIGNPEVDGSVESMTAAFSAPAEAHGWPADGFARSSDERFWWTPDGESTVWELGANGSIARQIEPEFNADGDPFEHISGVEEGATVNGRPTLYLGSNEGPDTPALVRVYADDGEFVSKVATDLDYRTENIVTDRETYAPREAILVKESGTGQYRVYEASLPARENGSDDRDSGPGTQLEIPFTEQFESGLNGWTVDQRFRTGDEREPGAGEFRQRLLTAGDGGHSDQYGGSVRLHVDGGPSTIGVARNTSGIAAGTRITAHYESSTFGGEPGQVRLLLYPPGDGNTNEIQIGGENGRDSSRNGTITGTVPRDLPAGTQVRVAAGVWPGEYTVYVDEIAASTGDDGREEPSTVPEPPRVTGTSTGDPHITTFDGTGYDFQAAGEYVLASTSNLTVQARQVPVGGRDVTVNTALATRVDGHRVVIDARDETALSIDGEPTPIDAGSSVTVGDSRVFHDGSAGTYTIVYAGANGQIEDGDRQLVADKFGDRIDIALHIDPDRAESITGLLGNADGVAPNDLATADGVVLDRPPAFDRLYGSFRESWRVTDRTTLFDYEDGQGPETYYDPDVPAEPLTIDDFDQQAVSEARTAAREAGLTPGTLNFRNAVLDYLVTGDSTYFDSADTAPTVPEENLTTPTTGAGTALSFEQAAVGEPPAGPWSIVTDQTPAGFEAVEVSDDHATDGSQTLHMTGNGDLDRILVGVDADLTGVATVRADVYIERANVGIGEIWFGRWVDGESAKTIGFLGQTGEGPRRFDETGAFTDLEGNVSDLSGEHELVFNVRGDNEAYFDNLRFLDADGNVIPTEKVVGSDGDGDGDGGDGGGDTGDGEPRLVLEPRSSTAGAGGSTTVDVVLTNANGGVGTYDEITVSAGDTGVARITGIDDATGAGPDTRTVAADGSSGSISAQFGGDTDETGNVTVATVTVAGEATGTTALSLGITGDLFTEAGSIYTLGGVRGGEITVRSGRPEVVAGTPAADTDNDGLLDDFNGNGAVDRGDAQALFASLGTQQVSQNAALLDYNGNGEVDRGDVQAIFAAATSS